MDTQFVRDKRYNIPPEGDYKYASLPPSSSAKIRVFPSDDPVKKAEVSSWALSRTRRIFDFFIAMIAFTAFLPLMALVALAVRLSSLGPAIFRQQRMGRNGKVFVLYKFRSMRLAPEHNSPITVTGDARITKIGKFLRKCKLDELPQFWNVLRGDMSLVGPRPKLPHHEGLHMPLRPGITGLATLAFRFEEEMLSRVPIEHLDTYYDNFVKPAKAKIDAEYMQKASLRMDFQILWKTAMSCFSKTASDTNVQLPVFQQQSEPHLRLMPAESEQ